MILQQTALFVIINFWSILIHFFNEYLLGIALEHAHQHLLVKLKKQLDFAPLEKLAVAYHHQSGPGSPVTASRFCPRAHTTRPKISPRT